MAEVLAVVEDLFFAAKIGETAQRLGVPLSVIRSPEELITQARVRNVISDLNGVSAAVKPFSPNRSRRSSRSCGSSVSRPRRSRRMFLKRFVFVKPRVLEDKGTFSYEPSASHGEHIERQEARRPVADPGARARPRPAGRRVERKASGVAEAVEHIAAASECPCRN